MTSGHADPISIRRLTHDDAETYRTFALQTLQDTPSAFVVTHDEYWSKPIEWIKERISSPQQPHNFVLGAFDQASSEMAGAVGLDVLPRAQERHKAILYGMAVSTSARGRGIGGTLVEQTLAEAARIQGVRQVLLMYSEGNTAAQRLYRSCGFVEFGREPRAMLMVDGRVVNKVHMIRMLDG
ncbi:GNAT family N-acetyltransferase [Microvirga pakistanensis]|uniref:GNAT family N-acetyltransferase n=1 Tax=Microvirga pakistanensis TaxID=1682650 RepID=UPI00106D0BC1|nr:GNAT family N-acetyltransferase [Microvirga pakistanensis]